MNIGILKQVYLPKFLLPLINNTANLVYYIFGLTILIVMMPIFKVPYTIHIFEFLLVVAVQFIFLFGLGLILSHIGVYATDLKNVLSFSIRFWFYMSPVLYDVKDVPEKYQSLFYLNPMTTFFESYRNVFLYGCSPNYLLLGIWFLVSIVLTYYGLKLFKKYDRNYTKVI